MSEAVISLLVVDDNMLSRLGITGLVSAFPDLSLVAVAASGGEALSLYQRLRPDVVMVDMKMPGLDGVDTIRLLKQQHAEARILVLSQYEGEEDLRRAFDAGALGYISKDDPGADIVKCIRAVSRGVRAMPPRLAEKWYRHEGDPLLATRERRVLDMVRQGMSNREIAAALQLSIKTVEKDMHGILHKLGVQNRAEAVAQAIRRGILDPHL